MLPSLVGDEHTQQVMVCSAPVTVADDHSTRHQQSSSTTVATNEGRGALSEVSLGPRPLLFVLPWSLRGSHVSWTSRGGGGGGGGGGHA
jgi:hypothetical protein